MARTRYIKPGFFKNEILAEIDPLGRILFAGLWCWADREGRLEDRPVRIKAEILPYDNCDIEALLNALAEKGFILRYEVDGNRYIQITTFKAHQNPHKKEAQSIIPPPAEYEESPGNSGTSTGKSDADTGKTKTSRARSLELDPRSLKYDQQQNDRNSNLESNSEAISATAADDNVDDWVKVDAEFSRLTGVPTPSPRDVQAMKHAVAMAEGRTDLIIEVMRACHKNYKPSYPGAKIRSFNYFLPAIQEAVATVRARSPSNGQALTDAEKAEIERLTEELTELLPDDLREVVDGG